MSESANRLRRVATVSVLVLLFHGSSDAGPLPPCVFAAVSNNQQFLATTQLSYGQGGSLTSVAFFIHPRLTSKPGTNTGISGPNAYWSSAVLWEVRTGGQGGEACPYPMISGDGESLVLIGNMFNSYAMKIYHRDAEEERSLTDGRHSRLVAKLSLAQLWPRQKSSGTWSTDAPQWFANDNFSFSDDNRKLIHRTKWGETQFIDLATGLIE